MLTNYHKYNYMRNSCSIHGNYMLNMLGMAQTSMARCSFNQDFPAATIGEADDVKSLLRGQQPVTLHVVTGIFRIIVHICFACLWAVNPINHVLRHWQNRPKFAPRRSCCVVIYCRPRHIKCGRCNWTTIKNIVSSFWDIVS